MEKEDVSYELFLTKKYIFIDEHLEEVSEFLIKKYTGNIIIDDDGLNTLSRMDLEILKKRRCNILLTPHLK